MTRGALKMKPIDRPFRFTWDFCLVWAGMAVSAYFFLKGWSDDQPRISFYGEVTFLSLFSTFVIYGPVLLIRQVIHSGVRGWFVLRALISIFLVVGLFFTVDWVFDLQQHHKSIVMPLMVAAVATSYLHYRTNNDDGTPRDD